MDIKKINDLYFPRHVIPDLKGVYLVGGVVRDIFLNRPYIDIDIAVESDPESLAQKLALHTNGRMVRLGKPPKEIYRVISSGHIIDISALQGDCIHEDLLGRDFTINALAYDLKSGEIIDPCQGAQDIRNHKIRMISKQAFERDPLRMLRAFRLSAELQFDIEHETLRTIKEKSMTIKRSARERIREELFKTLASKNSYPYLSLMAETSILYEIFPKITQWQERHPNKISEHALSACYHLEALLNHRTDRDFNISFSRPFNSALLKFTLLILILAIGTSDTVHNYRFGAVCGISDTDIIVAAKQVCFRLRLSKKQTRYIESVLGGYQILFNLFINYRGDAPLNRKSAKFFIKCRELTSDVVYLAVAYIKGSKVRTSKNKSLFCSFAQEIMNDYLTRIKPLFQKPPLLNGKDLIRSFGMSSSPIIGHILSVLEEERLSGKICTRQDALKRAKELIFND